MVQRHATPSGIREQIDTAGLSPHEINVALRAAYAAGVREVILENVSGQRFIGAGLTAPDMSVAIYGIPGNDLGMFMEHSELSVFGNAQDGVGNTMSSGTICIDGHAGDVLGYGMRGGTILVNGDVGYRAGINMKEYGDESPTIVVGGRARDFLGEYMAGGRIIVLGMESRFSGELVGGFAGSGMHAGSLYLRGAVSPWLVGDALDTRPASKDDLADIEEALGEYAAVFEKDLSVILDAPFTVIRPTSNSPYGSMYTPL